MMDPDTIAMKAEAVDDWTELTPRNLSTTQHEGPVTRKSRIAREWGISLRVI